MIYGVQKNATGAVLSVVRFNGDVLPTGFTACSQDDFNTIKAALGSTLLIQAQNKLAVWQGKAAMAVAMGQTFTAAERTYVAALQAIVNGTDTTSTALPTDPDDVTVA